MKNKEVRKMKVYSQSGYQYKDTPTIILKGQWLQEAGFSIGCPIQIETENGMLRITKSVDRLD